MKTFTFEFNEQELQVIAAALQEAPIPYKMSAPIIQKFQEQYDNQNADKEPTNNVVSLKD